jgi:tRNA nucleotidyltransferase (CCA-adding enzyme)
MSSEETNMLEKLMTPETRKLGDAFQAAGYEIRFVGGCVRDAILGEKPKDVDFTTDATPEEMRVIARENGMGFIETGLAHGTATLVVNREPFEVTTLRVDVETDGRHANVEFTRDFRVDAERRDLTINAMSMDMRGEVFDYFGGREDLKNRVVRFVGDARQRVEEDYLRILRYFRFAARFNAKMDDATLAVFSDGAVLDRLNQVSVERFWQEMSKLLDPSTPGRVAVVDAIFRTRVNRALGVFRFNPVDLVRSDDALSALSSLVDPKDVDRFFQFWKVSASEEKKVRWLVLNRDVVLDEVKVEVQLTNEKVERDYLVSLLEMRGETLLAQYVRDFQIPTFPVGGADLIKAGMAPGPQMGERLARMRRGWAYSRWTSTRETLMEIQ